MTMTQDLDVTCSRRRLIEQFVHVTKGNTAPYFFDGVAKRKGKIPFVERWTAKGYLESSYPFWQIEPTSRAILIRRNGLRMLPAEALRERVTKIQIQLVYTYVRTL